VDGCAGTEYSAVTRGTLSFSPLDGARVAYFGRRACSVLLVLNGAESRPYDGLVRGGKPCFTEDGILIAFLRRRDCIVEVKVPLVVAPPPPEPAR